MRQSQRKLPGILIIHTETCNSQFTFAKPYNKSFYLFAYSRVFHHVNHFSFNIFYTLLFRIGILKITPFFHSFIDYFAYCCCCFYICIAIAIVIEMIIISLLDSGSDARASSLFDLLAFFCRQKFRN